MKYTLKEDGIYFMNHREEIITQAKKELVKYIL